MAEYLHLPWEPLPTGGERVVVGRMLLRAHEHYWHVDACGPFGAWMGYADDLDANKRAATRCAKRQMGLQRWESALEQAAQEQAE